MARKNAARTPRLTRAEKLRQERIVAKVPVLSSGEPATISMPKLDAKNANQKLALRYLNEGTTLTWLVGAAGTGKTMLAAYRAAVLLKSKAIEKIYILRPAISTGKTSGFLPGTLSEKLLPYFAPLIGHFETFLGKGFTTYAMEKEVIEMKAIEYTRGTNFKDCFVIVDEGQNLTLEEYNMLLTRIGTNCQVVVTGDQSQHDLRGESGLSAVLKLLKNVTETGPEYMTDDDLDVLHNEMAIVNFGLDDVVRSGITKAFVKLFHHA